MFYFAKELDHEVRLNPKMLNKEFLESCDIGDTMAEAIDKNESIRPFLQMAVYRKAYLDLKDKIDPRLGVNLKTMYVDVLQAFPAKIEPQNGFIRCAVKFGALFQLPVVGEVIDVSVVKVTHQSVIFEFIDSCLISGIVPRERLSDEYVFGTKETEVDGKKVVDEYFQSVDDTTKTIRKGTAIRIRIVNRRNGGTCMWVTGKMDEEFLGPVDPLKKAMTLPKVFVGNSNAAPAYKLRN